MALEEYKADSNRNQLDSTLQEAPERRHTQQVGREQGMRAQTWSQRCGEPESRMTDHLNPC